MHMGAPQPRTGEPTVQVAAAAEGRVGMGVTRGRRSALRGWRFWEGCFAMFVWSCVDGSEFQVWGREAEGGFAVRARN